MRNAWSAGWTTTEVTTHTPPPSGLGGCACPRPGLSGLGVVDGVPGLRLTFLAVRKVGQSAAREIGTLITALLGAFKLETVGEPAYVADGAVQTQYTQSSDSTPGSPFWVLTVTSGPFRGKVLSSTVGGTAPPPLPTDLLIEQWVVNVRAKTAGDTLDVGALREAVRKMTPPATERAVELITVPAPPQRFAQAGTVLALFALFALAAITRR